jgi:hypothetical protein
MLAAVTTTLATTFYCCCRVYTWKKKICHWNSCISSSPVAKNKLYCYFILRGKMCSWGQFHQHYSRLTLNLSVYSEGHTERKLSIFSTVVVGHNGEVGRNFVCESEWRLLAPKNDYVRICALCNKVGEIDPRSRRSRRRSWCNDAMQTLKGDPLVGVEGRGGGKKRLGRGGGMKGNLLLLQQSSTYTDRRMVYCKVGRIRNLLRNLSSFQLQCWDYSKFDVQRCSVVIQL